MKKYILLLAFLLLCLGAGATQAFAAAPYVPVYSTNNNFTLLDPYGVAIGGANDVLFTWDGTLKTSVAVSGQVANATIYSNCPFQSFTWRAHDVAIYGPGTYTVYSGCSRGSPGCGIGTPLTFTVGTDEIGVHMLFDWGTVSANHNIDVVNVWMKNAVFGPSALRAGDCGFNPYTKVWDLMSRDDGTGKNGYPMVEGGLASYRANFNMMGPVTNRPVDTSNNNFTMNDPVGGLTGGTNDVRFTWDGTRKTSVAASGQISNATLSSPCPFFGNNWFAHDVAIYGPGTYTVYTSCPGGSPGCGVGTPYTFTVNSGEIGGHILFNWGTVTTTSCGLAACDIDMVDVWRPGVFGPSEMWTGGCGAGDAAMVWDHMSYDWDGDGINGAAMVEGPTPYNANFNMMGNSQVCTTDADCNDNNVCTTDTCDPATGCVFAPINCNDNNACTADSCDPATGACMHTPVVCNDHSACTVDSCNPATGCVFTPINCDDNNACTIDTCYPATGCVHTPVNGDDRNACTIDYCDPAIGILHVPIVCNDNNACTADSCNPATGCVFTPIVCNDNNACTADTCDPATGCVYTPIVCDDNDACTADTCDPLTGCQFTLIPGSTKTVTIRGGGQKPSSVDLEIRTTFTVMNDGCISGSTASTVTCTPGTIMLVDFKAGQGPPTSCTWNGVSLGGDYSLTITCPDVSGEVGKLICDNKDGGGKDVDRITVTVQ